MALLCILRISHMQDLRARVAAMEQSSSRYESSDEVGEYRRTRHSSEEGLVYYIRQTKLLCHRCSFPQFPGERNIWGKDPSSRRVVSSCSASRWNQCRWVARYFILGRKRGWDRPQTDSHQPNLVSWGGLRSRIFVFIITPDRVALCAV